MSLKNTKSIGKSASAGASLSSLGSTPKKNGGLSVVKTATKSAGGLSVVKAKGGLNLADNRKQEQMEAAVLEAVKSFSNLGNGAQQESAIKFYETDKDGTASGLNYLILARIAKSRGMSSPAGKIILADMNTFINSMDDTRENGLLMFQALLDALERGFEPYAVPLLPRLVQLHVDKIAHVRDVATTVAQKLCGMMCPQSFRLVCPLILTEAKNENWKIKVTVMNLLKIIAPRMSEQISPLLPVLIPAVSDCVYDSKKQVQTAALEALTETCQSISNDDIRPLTPQLVSVIAHPEESERTLNLLLETTFVANVDASVMALLAPLLGKSLKNRSSVMRRKASKVIDIMCRLVQDPADVAPFKDMLLPSLERVIDELVDAEVCDVATAAREILLKALGEGKVDLASAASKLSGAEAAAAEEAHTVYEDLLSSLTRSEQVLPLGSSADPVVLDYVAKLSANLIVYDVALETTNASADSPAAGEEGDVPPTIDAEDPNGAVSVAASAASASWHDKVALTPINAWKNCSVPYFQAMLSGSHSVFREAIVAAVSTTTIPPSLNQDSSAVITGGAVLEEKSSCSSSSRAEDAHVDANADADEEMSPAVRGLRKMSLGRDEHNPAEASPGELAEKLTSLLRAAALHGVQDQQADNDDDATDLCNIEFSLAYGGKILLHNAFLKLGRGRRYGVMGKNGAGKTTLLTNIGSGNIEGLPPSLRTVYVQHDDVTEDNGVSLIDELMASKQVVEAKATREEAEKALKDIHFTQTMLESPRSSLSGGWKMKLLIIRAMLAKADVLLLDEPTNHLDTASVNWLVEYIQSQPELTCLIVSHDTHFMDRVLTDVIHYEGKKLAYYHGNLTHFVNIHPEAKFYFELEGSTLSFKFPVPGRLDGVNSSTRAILKMDNVTFTYPGKSKPTLSDVSVKVCLGSRVAVLGPNGAGKSTLIKMLVQETQPDEGSGAVWKHMNLRIAYVAQHSFHHIEQHLDSSPVDYIKWRFHGGVDREDLARPSKKLTEDEEAAVGAKAEKRYGDVLEVHGRRKNGRTMEYECSYVGQIVGREPNKYIPLDKMVELGLEKLVLQCDAKTAAMAAGLDVRPLLTAEIQAHLDDFALEAEFGTHGTIKRLSGGQKVKLVLAAAMWNCPHVIVLDEPTNYLDREALGALTQAIKNFSGGVVIISHNSEFTDAICSETWDVREGKCFTKGGAEETTVKSSKVKKSSSASNLPAEDNAGNDSTGNMNKTINSEILLNPKTLEALSKKQMRLLERCAQTAGVTPKDYLSKINFKSPEWKWL